jgi:FkbM family methyltransferase
MTQALPQRLAARVYRLLNRPYYVYHPTRIVRRLLRARSSGGEQPRLLQTAWGSRLWCFGDSIGSAVERTGTYELAVSEALVRLAAHGETAVDAGANVGLFSNLLANAVGGDGRVIAFEPHPEIHAALARNVDYWRGAEALGNVHPRTEALSSLTGASELTVWADFAENRGTASLEPVRSGFGHGVEVPTVRLDEALGDSVGVLKLDVEEHELAALQGAERLLAAHAIRDIVFESHRVPPTAVTELLEGHGYAVLAVRQGLSGPILSAPGEGLWRQMWDPSTLLATCDAERARSLFRARGWRSLRRVR